MIKKDTLILGKGLAQGLDGITLTAEKEHSIRNIMGNKTNSVQLCIMIRCIITYLLMVLKYTDLKQKTLK